MTGPGSASQPAEAVVERLRSVAGFVFDLDGTLALGDEQNRGLKPRPGAVELLCLLRERGTPFVILTNGTVRVAVEYFPKLSGIGLPVEPDSVLTPSDVAAAYFLRRGLQRVLALGEEGVWRPLEAAGLEIFRPGRGALPEVQAVWVGWYPGFGMADITAAVEAVEAGAGLYSASGTPWFSTAGGKTLGTSMVICGAVEAVTGRRAVILGKPSEESLLLAAERLGVPVPDLAIVGDDPRLEIAMAHQGGCLAVYVDSGVGGKAPFAGLAHEALPHLSVKDPGELLDLLLAGG